MRTRAFGWDTIYGAPGSAGPYMTRFWIGRLRLHIFHRGDADPDPHDHPWDFWTFPLTPYVEEVTRENRLNPGTYLKGRLVVGAFRWHRREATHLHRVIGRFDGWWIGSDGFLYPAEAAIGDYDEPRTDDRRIITIVWRGKGERSWGFLKHRDGRWCWVHWKEYVFAGGKHAPCAPAEKESRRRTRVNNAVIGE